MAVHYRLGLHTSTVLLNYGTEPPRNHHQIYIVARTFQGLGEGSLLLVTVFDNGLVRHLKKKDHHIYKSPPRDLQSIQPLPIMCTTKVKSILWEIFYAYAVEYTSMKGQPYQLPTEVYISETNDYLALSRPDYPSPDFVLCPVTLRLHG